MDDGEFNEHNPFFQIKLLAYRLDALGREKEKLEEADREHDRRLNAIEHALAVGWGVLIVIPILGAILGFVFAYGKIIFGPWFKVVP